MLLPQLDSENQQGLLAQTAYILGELLFVRCSLSLSPKANSFLVEKMVKLGYDVGGFETQKDGEPVFEPETMAVEEAMLSGSH